MSQVFDKNKDTTKGKADSVGSLASEEEVEEDDEEDTGREETPDLYRNPSLGMCVSIFPPCIFLVLILVLVMAG